MWYCRDRLLLPVKRARKGLFYEDLWGEKKYTYKTLWGSMRIYQKTSFSIKANDFLSRINENQGNRKTKLLWGFTFVLKMLESDRKSIKSKQTPNKNNQIRRLKSTLGGSWSETARICIKIYEDCMRILWGKYTAIFSKVHFVDHLMKNRII